MFKDIFYEKSKWLTPCLRGLSSFPGERSLQFMSFEVINIHYDNSNKNDPEESNVTNIFYVGL